MESRRLLYVEDDANIRVATAAVLQGHGFEVVAVSTVTDALRVISSEHFDLLISDLNLGQPGDGFTVTSAMRRVQPHCPTVILTGYPEFEAALTAIRDQVDDFVVKPADFKALLATIRSRIEAPARAHVALRQTLAEFLTDNRGEIVRRVLQAMRSHPRLSQLPLTDAQREEHLHAILSEIIASLADCDLPEEHPDGASRHGELRRLQGYSPVMLVDDLRLVDGVIYELISENLLAMNLSRLIPDLGKMNQSIEFQLQQSLYAFHASDESA